ncbi:ROK family protein [Streptomyces sp. NPDC014724]|uniref:ROK family protein n=1 Tax=unclassified Streptomyces TaxID=2593676 RepID=UPI0036F795E4
MNPDDDGLIAVMDVGGTHVTAACVDMESRSLVRGQSFREPLDGDGTAAEIVASLVRCAQRLPGSGASRWAIAVPGPFDYGRGVGRYEGVGKFDTLRGFDLRAALTERLPGVRDLTFHNDADAFVWGEWWTGAAHGYRSVAGITLGTGVGSGFVRDGHMLREGPGIPPEGCVHLLEHEGRPLEETVSRRALRRAYAHATGDTSADVQEIAERARHGERTALAVLTRAFRALGTVIAPVLAAAEAEVLVVGGSIAGAWDLIAEPLGAGVAGAGPAGSRPHVLVPADHLLEAPLLGAARMAAEGALGS